MRPSQPSKMPIGGPKKNKFRHNWRIDMLAIPKHNKLEMILFPMPKQLQESYLERKKCEALEIKKAYEEKQAEFSDKGSLRQEELSLLPTRFYKSQQEDFKSFGQRFKEHMDQLMKKQKESKYHEYDRAKADLKRAKSPHKIKIEKIEKKGGKIKTKGKSKVAFIQKGGGEKKHRISRLAKPHFPPSPPRINRGKSMKIEFLQQRLKRLATPKHYTLKYCEDPNAWKTILAVPKETLLYKATARTAELATPRRLSVVVNNPLVYVDPQALNAKASKRILELCIPKPKRDGIETEEKAEAFKVSPTALKYKPSARILQLAKPLPRK